MTRRAAMVVCVGAAAALAVSVPRARAETGLPVPATCAAPAGGAVLRLNVLVLLDNSGSLATNDPGMLRAQGAKDAVLVLDSLSTRRADHAEVRIAIDSFNTGYTPGEGWIDAAGSSRLLIGRIDSIAAIPAGRTLTDYTAAMRGAAARFDEAGEGCNLLIWFTDGEHVTHGTAAEVEPAEWSQLTELCQGPEMESLRRRAWTGAVRLRAADGSGSGETLRHLFGATYRGCAHALRGDIYDDFAPADLGRLLHDVIAVPAEDLLFRADPHKLPGEPDDPPAEPEYQPCAGGDGAHENPCRIVFRLGGAHESFRLFVDLTFLRRGVRNPSDLSLVLRSPDGRLSEVLRGGAESVEAGAGGRYRALAPFGFHSRAHYPGELEILGHRVAESRSGGSSGGWRWNGDWTLLVSGETPEARADARRAAAAVRRQAAAAPSADSLGIDADGTLSGFVDGFPARYDDVALHIRVDGAGGTPLYATRLSVTGEPLAVDGEARRFAVPGFLDLLVEWDSPAGGGNGRNLREALLGPSPTGGAQPDRAPADGPPPSRRAGAGATAVLTQTLRYPGPPDSPLLVWRRDIGTYRLSAAEGAEVVRRIDGHARLAELLGALSDSARVWLPGRLALGEPQLNADAGAATLWASAVPGAVAGTLTLALDGDGSAAGSFRSLDPLRPDTGGTRLWAAPWSCRVPSAQDHRDSGLDGPFRCPAPLRLGLAAPHDTEFTAVLDIEVVEEAGTVDELLAPLWFAPGSAGAAPVAARLEAALGRERRVQHLVSAPFVLDIPEPPVPVAVSDVLAEFLPMAAVLAAAAAAARLAMAWRLRPWPALGSADYAVAQLRGDDGLDALRPPDDVERGIRMDLLRPASAARIAGVVIRSRWWPLLLGRERSVVARVRAARCFGPKGRLRSPLRRGSRARIGADIDRGWVATASGEGLRLVVWDLPADERSAQEQIQNAGRDAAAGARRLAAADRPRRRRRGGARGRARSGGGGSGPRRPRK